MATTPLFLPDIATVKARLRMTGVPAGTDAESLIEEAIRTVRVGFYRKLSSSRITTLLGYASTDNPSTSTEVLRVQAEITELKWIRYELMRTIPTLFFDSSPSSGEAWNREGLVRGMGTDERTKEMDRLMADVIGALDGLEGVDEYPNEVSNKVQAFAPAPPVPAPGDSLFGGWRSW
jgi:hypothetical protein